MIGSASSSSSSSSAASSPMGTSVASNASSTSSSYKSSTPPVIRNGHIIPQIRLTPPDTRPEKSIPVPEQDLGNDHLFVPLRTEEIGWEEGGLIWAAKRYCYPTVNLYGGDDDRVIGTYRGGPEGYRFVKITDPAFSLAGQTATEEEKPTKKTSASGSKSSMPRGPATTQAAPSAPPAEAPEAKPLQRSYSSVSSASSSAASSRQGSFSTDDGNSSGGDTGATTPTMSESPVEEGGSMAKRLDDALQKVHQAQVGGDDDVAMREASTSTSSGSTTKLAKRAGAPVIPSDPVDASRLSGPFKAQQLPDEMRGRTVRLADDVPTRHFQTYQGRAKAEPAMLLSSPPSCDADDAEQAARVAPMLVTAAAHTDDYAAGWAYEQNMRAEHAVNDTAMLVDTASPLGR